MIDVVRKQVEAGIDIPNDGEFPHVSWNNYLKDRLGGFELRKRQNADASRPRVQSHDRRDFEGFYSYMASTGATYYRTPQSVGPPGTAQAPDPEEAMERVCTAPITYIGGPQLQQDIANFKVALAAANVSEGFLNATAADLSMLNQRNEYYCTTEEFLYARAAALREEFRAIVDSGLTLQVDDPNLVNWGPGDTDLDGYGRYAAQLVELVNYSLEGIPEDRVRLHVCYGSWLGPHSSDISLRHAMPYLLQVRVGAYSFEAANARHEHEWAAWRDVKLPDGKRLLPGIVTHHTNTVEHPDLVAWRLKLYADVVGKDNLIASTDCGLGYRVHPELQWAKLETLSEGSRRASEQLW